jgi:hypothetical protein
VAIAANVLADTSTGPGIKSLIDFLMPCSQVGRVIRFMQTQRWVPAAKSQGTQFDGRLPPLS